MRTVRPVATTTLKVRAYFARGWGGGWVLATESKDVVVVDASLTVTARIEVGAKPHGIAMTDTGAILAVASGRTLSAIDVERGRPKWRADGNYNACFIVDSSLWAAVDHRSEIEVSLRDVASGAVKRTTRLADPFGGSSVMLFPHPDERSVIAWVAAGQDGQAAYLLTDTGATIEAAELAPRNCLPPVFLPDGKSYLSAGDETLECYRWPSGERLGSAQWPAAEGDGEDPSGSDLQIVPGGYVTWSSTNGRIHIVDLVDMRLVDELAIDGHPLRTVEELYPSLRGDRTLCTDFHYAEPGPEGLILTVHDRTQLVASRLRDWSPNAARVVTRNAQ